MEWIDVSDDKFVSITKSNGKLWQKNKDFLLWNGFSLYVEDGKWYLKFTGELYEGIEEKRDYLISLCV